MSRAGRVLVLHSVFEGLLDTSAAPKADFELNANSLHPASLWEKEAK